MIPVITTSGDCSSILQYSFDNYKYVEPPEGEFIISRPVLIDTGRQFVGKGPATRFIQSGTNDMLVSLPPAIRYYDNSSHFVDNPFDSVKYSYRTHGKSGIRVWGQAIDRGDWQGNGTGWGDVKKLTVDFVITRHGSLGGGIWGMIHHKIVGDNYGGNYPASPLAMYDATQSSGHLTGYLDLHVTTADRKFYYFRWYAGPHTGQPERFRLSIDMTTGSVDLYKDGLECSEVNIMGNLPAGSRLLDNEGSAFWVGNLSDQGGADGNTSEGGSADVTFHAFNIWMNDPPPINNIGYWWNWHGDKVYCLTMNKTEKPTHGLPFIRWTGYTNEVGYAYLVPKLFTEGTEWNQRIRIDNIHFARSMTNYNHGDMIHIQSALHTDISRIFAEGGSNVVRVSGGPLNNYPVILDRIHGLNMTDSVVQIHRANRVTATHITGEFPARSVARFYNCSEIKLDEVWHSPDSAEWVKDVLYFGCCGPTTVSNFDSNYESGIGPQRNYLYFCGPPAFPKQWLKLVNCNGHINGKEKGLGIHGTASYFELSTEKAFERVDTV